MFVCSKYDTNPWLAVLCIMLFFAQCLAYCEIMNNSPRASEVCSFIHVYLGSFCDLLNGLLNCSWKNVGRTPTNAKYHHCSKFSPLDNYSHHGLLEFQSLRVHSLSAQLFRTMPTHNCPSSCKSNVLCQSTPLPAAPGPRKFTVPIGIECSY